jgi:hypothetical protein
MKMSLIVVLMICISTLTEQTNPVPILENDVLRLEFDSQACGLSAIVNKLTGEKYAVGGDAFTIETTTFQRTQTEMRRVGWALKAGTLTARYADADLTVEVAYELRTGDNFFQKRITITFAANGGVKQLVISRPTFALKGLDIVCYRHPDFDWISEYVRNKHGWDDLKRPPDSEPTRTFFGRTSLGGFFAGVEMPYDNSHMEKNALFLGYAPSLKVREGEQLACEVMYFGVYRRSERDMRATEWTPIPAASLFGQKGVDGFDGAAAAGLSIEQPENRVVQPTAIRKVLPLPSESASMTAMTSAILGPARHGLMAFACGYHSQMEQAGYDSDEKLEGDLRSLEFLASCGLDGVMDSHPWGGETGKMANLRDGDHYVPSARVYRFLEYARKQGLKVTQFSTMNNTHPWRKYGGPFRLDKSDWLRGVNGEALGGENAANFLRRQANCLACKPFYEWLERIIVYDALGTGLYGSWCMDGDFWGTGAYFHTTLPVTCLAGNHEHLSDNANYACQRRLDQLTAEVRRLYPGMYITMCRPKMDLGVWAQRNVDACFTLIESGTGGSNISAGNEVRTASRIRVQHHFFPHWLDWPLLFPCYGDPNHQPEWPKGKLDYLMLSALSCSPNLLLYLPTKTGIPEADKAEIRKWLNWGRENAEYLFVRHDLFEWPGKGTVDGSAHLRGDHGLIFLFNPDMVERTAEFALTTESIGFTGSGPVEVRQEYPVSDNHEIKQPGATVRWKVPSESVIVLRVTLLPPMVGNELILK